MFYCPVCEPDGDKGRRVRRPRRRGARNTAQRQEIVPTVRHWPAMLTTWGCPRKEPMPAEPPAGGLGKWLCRKILEGHTGPR